MEKKLVYFSYAYTSPEETINTIKTRLANFMLINVAFYQKGTEYSDDPIKNCDLFVIYLPGNASEAVVGKLSPGIQRELILAISLKKDIIVATLGEDNYVTFSVADVDYKERMIKTTVFSDVLAMELLTEPKRLHTKVTSDLNWLDTQNETDIIL